MIRKANKVTKKEDECAREVLDVVPTVMRFIRTEMRSHRALELSVPQFRSLVYIERTAGTSLLGVAEQLGLTSPSACKLIDGLANRGMVTRGESPGDRRRVTLEITARGARALAGARRESQQSLSRLLGALDGEDLSAVTRAMSALRRVFVTGARSPSERRSRFHGNP